MVLTHTRAKPITTLVKDSRKCSRVRNTWGVSGAVSGHYIPQNAAAASGNNAHEGQQDDAVNVGGLIGGLNAVHGKDAQSDGVEQ